MDNKDKHSIADRKTLIDPPAWIDKPNVQESRAVARFRHALKDVGRSDDLTGQQLGRYLLIEKLGSGGMGTVYRAHDQTGRTVAVKVISSSLTERPDLLARFQKEARLLSEVSSRYVTRLYEVDEDRGIHFLAVEYVEGGSLAELIAEQSKLAAETAVGIAADIARGLADIHPRGIIHRDIKPGNILVQHSGSAPMSAKLTDFGLARHVIQSRSMEMTRSDALIGTPVYMSPEQCSGNHQIDGRSDIYSLGATLFHLLTGRPPFTSDDLVQTMELHRHVPAPRLNSVDANISDGLTQVVAKTLEKRPEHRYADARALLEDLERLLRGDAIGETPHPIMPEHAEGRVLDYCFTWELASAPRDLWPHISNTDRFNEAIGLPAVDFTSEHDEDAARRFGNVRFAGIPMRWREYPFEWVRERRMGVLREFASGPLKWVTNTVEMAPSVTHGTTLTHRFRVAPRGYLGWLFAQFQIGVATARALDRVYRRIDSATRHHRCGHNHIDPFRAPHSTTARRRRRLDRILDALSERGSDAVALMRIGEYVRTAPAQELGRIKPRVLAHTLELAENEVLAVCLLGATDGLFVLGWDVICPACLVASEFHDTLAAVQAHGSCEACNASFRVDFANSVELVFRTHPQIRDVETRTYCIGGPSHSPHVAAQTRVAAKERCEIPISLSEGYYRIRGPQLPRTYHVKVDKAVKNDRLLVELSGAPTNDQLPDLCAGHQMLVLHNNYERELLVRVEASPDRSDAITAAQALAMPLFRECFPAETISPEQLSSLSHLSFLATIAPTIDQLRKALGVQQAEAALQAHFRRLCEQGTAMGAVWFKLFQERAVLGFLEPGAAVRAAVSFASEPTLPGESGDWKLRAGVHCGPATAATINGQTEYFGPAVDLALGLADRAKPGETVVSEGVAKDGEVAAIIDASPVECARGNGGEGGHLLRLLARDET